MNLAQALQTLHEVRDFALAVLCVAALCLGVPAVIGGLVALFRKDV